MGHAFFTYIHTYINIYSGKNPPSNTYVLTPPQTFSQIYIYLFPNRVSLRHSLLFSPSSPCKYGDLCFLCLYSILSSPPPPPPLLTLSSFPRSFLISTLVLSSRSSPCWPPADQSLSRILWQISSLRSSHSSRFPVFPLRDQRRSASPTPIHANHPLQYYRDPQCG